MHGEIDRDLQVIVAVRAVEDGCHAIPHLQGGEHLAHIGHPLLGDGKYGINRADRAHGYKYQALWSYRLAFRFETDGGILSYLDGRVFTVPYEKIYFLKEFPSLRLEEEK